MNEPTITLPLSTFNELKRALGIAIKYRSEQLSEDRANGNLLAPHIKDSLCYDVNLWLDLQNDLNH